LSDFSAMSAAAPPIITPEPTAPPVEGTSRFAAARGWIASHFWAIGDQGLISATNFATGVLTARALAPGEFGTFSIIYGVLLWCNIFQSTLVTQAHNVLAATRTGWDYRRYTSSTAVGQLLLVVIEVLLAAPVALVAHAQGWASEQMLLALLPAIFFWQLQEFVRRVLYTEGRFGAAFFNDVISYGGQTAVLAYLFVERRAGHIQFTGALPLWVLAGTSAVAVLLGLWQLRRSVAATFDARDLKENWHFGKWLVGGELMGWCSQLPMQMWWAALIVGTVASADLRAAQILFGPTRVIAFFLGTILPIRFAQRLHREGEPGLRAAVRTVYVMLVPVVGLYCVLLAAFPRPLLHLIYGDEYMSPASVQVLMLYALSSFLNYMQMVLLAALTAARRTPTIFAGNVWGCGVALVMSPTCIFLFGAPGGIVSIIVTTLVVTSVYVITYRQGLARVPAGARGRGKGAAG
jgi:O-antigen/teichoic acid export membrane protein